jgi:hypothetical protein
MAVSFDENGTILKQPIGIVFSVMEFGALPAGT